MTGKDTFRASRLPSANKQFKKGAYCMSESIQQRLIKWSVYEDYEMKGKHSLRKELDFMADI